MIDDNQTSTQELEAECLEFITKSGLKLTEPRKIILRAALASEGDFDAEELQKLAHEEDKLISLATIYRTLPILLKSGILRKSDSDSEKQHYELNIDAKKSIKLICAEDDSIVELEDDCLWLRLQFLAKQKGFIAKNIDIRIDVERSHGT